MNYDQIKKAIEDILQLWHYDFIEAHDGHDSSIGMSKQTFFKDLERALDKPQKGCMGGYYSHTFFGGNVNCELPKPSCRAKDCHAGFIPHSFAGIKVYTPCECECHYSKPKINPH